MRIVFLLTSILLLFTGCTKRYWYRTKIDLAKSKRYSVKIEVVNESNELLDKEFEKVMRESSVRALEKKGFFELPVDSPQFLFTLMFKVGSFSRGGQLTPRDLGLHMVSENDSILLQNAFHSGSSMTASGSRTEQVKAVMIVCLMRHYKQGWVKWVCADDLYYFGEPRDLGRAEGMVRHLIKIAKDKQAQSNNAINHY